ncbi:MAG: hypothetical protein KatS3mg087_1320 [Patescibacteria group bacterium]|nr:MAG: hypothetical protein KatS3mg087_1320 [Patescibacteria group bacterium]
MSATAEGVSAEAPVKKRGRRADPAILARRAEKVVEVLSRYATEILVDDEGNKDYVVTDIVGCGTELAALPFRITASHGTKSSSRAVQWAIGEQMVRRGEEMKQDALTPTPSRAKLSKFERLKAKLEELVQSLSSSGVDIEKLRNDLLSAF